MIIKFVIKKWFFAKIVIMNLHEKLWRKSLIFFRKIQMMKDICQNHRYKPILKKKVASFKILNLDSLKIKLRDFFCRDIQSLENILKLVGCKKISRKNTETKCDSWVPSDSLRVKITKFRDWRSPKKALIVRLLITSYRIWIRWVAFRSSSAWRG